MQIVMSSQNQNQNKTIKDAQSAPQAKLPPAAPVVDWADMPSGEVGRCR